MNRRAFCGTLLAVPLAPLMPAPLMPPLAGVPFVRTFGELAILRDIWEPAIRAELDRRYAQNLAFYSGRQWVTLEPSAHSPISHAGRPVEWTLRVNVK